MSTPITLTFLPDEYKPLLDGQITATIRLGLDLKPGDKFYAGSTGLLCRITSARRLSVGQAVTMHYRAMGFASRNEALIRWHKLHPHIGHLLHHRVGFYRFEQVPDQTVPMHAKATAEVV